MQEKEIWKTIDGFNGDYQISNFGNLIMFYHGKWQPKASHVTRAGYFQTTLQRNGIKRRCGIHQLVAEYFVGGWFEGAEVNHKDLNKLNNRWDNLEWVTRSQNQQHQIKARNRQKKKKFCKICGKEISKSSTFCPDCYSQKQREEKWPKYEELFECLKTMNYTRIGKKFNKSDNAIRKICKAYNLPYNTKDLKQFRKDNNCYIPTQKELQKPKEERYVHYEIDGIKNTAYGWSLHLGLEEKRIGRFAKKHTYEETIEYIKSFIK